MERVPLFSGDKATGQGSTSLADVAAVVSNAVVEGLKASGLMSTFPQDQNFSKGQNSDLAASVQGSVAGVIQDMADESVISNISISKSCGYTHLRFGAFQRVNGLGSV